MFSVTRYCAITGLLPLLCFAQSSQPGDKGPATPPPVASSSPSPTPTTSTTASALNAALAPTTVSLGDALALYRKGDFAAALAAYNSILQAKPKSPDAYAGIIRCYLRQGKIDQAAQAADQALAASDSARVHTAHAEVLFRQGKINEADKEWVSVANSGYPEPRAYLGLARVRNASAMYKTAARMLNKAHELDPSDPEIQELWIETLSRRQRIKFFEESLAHSGWDPVDRASATSYLQHLKDQDSNKDHACHLVGNVTATETPLLRLFSDPNHLRGYGLSVEVNGHKSSLMLDTGASGILVKRAIAEHAGISKISETKVWGIGDKGKRNAFIGTADSIKIGALEFRNCPIEVMESRSVADEQGLIGADVFEQFLVDIDFPGEKLKLSQLPQRPGETAQTLGLKAEGSDSDDSAALESRPDSNAAEGKTPPSPSTPASFLQDRYISPEMHSYTRLLRFGHELLIPTSIGNVSAKLFLIDTGSLTNFISPAAAREVTKVSTDPDTIVKGLSGTVEKVYSANKAILQFGGLRQENQDITAFDTNPISSSTGTEISGFLGFTTLRLLDIKIDYRDALISFSFDPKKWRYQ
jgi:tetratricopeptide (TPR) repeat protein